MNTPRVVLASTSRYRAELLRRLLPDFEQVAPGVDEFVEPGEAPAERAARLARLKALAVAENISGAIVIGSDQVAELDGHVLDKPGSAANARTQLQMCSGQAARFHTALCVIDTRRGNRASQAADLTRVVFRTLSADEITRYIELERPLDCAGGFKAEGLGISLFDRIESTDPTALIGLPLIALAKLLRDRGICLP
ncbi:MAG TPA: nucleoside triphosphate pyrophosphatase [Rhodanobacteraceae bacterium]|jgi:septum formation protein|nr:nucleoside triphosphate pyrophosphatase [Rhodanobacteraceae bacterium]